MVPDWKRIAFCERFFQSAEVIASSTTVPEAKTYWSYLKEKGLLVAPGKVVVGNVTFRRLQSATGSKTIFPEKPPLILLPLYEEDVAISLEYMSLVTTRATAIFRGSMNIVFILANHSGESDFVKGCILIHEAGHAYKAWQGNRLFREPAGNNGRPEWLLREEAELNFLDARLWKERGGLPYSQLLDHACEWLASQQSSPCWCVPERNLEWLSILDNLFGTARHTEQMNRWFHFWLYAHFEFLERSPWTSPERDRVELMRTVYSSVSM